MVIINLTQHVATADQRAVGVVDMADRQLVCDLLNFEELPTNEQMRNRAETLASLIDMPANTQVMIGGAPFFMAFLIESLKKRGFRPLFAFSKRVSVENVGEDGRVVKTSVFKHEGFIEV
jgi:hypothetical protein